MLSRATLLSALAASLLIAGAVALVLDQRVGAAGPAVNVTEIDTGAAGPEPSEPGPAQGEIKAADAPDAGATRIDRQPLLAVPPGAQPLIWVRKGKRIPVRTEPRGGQVVEVADRRTEFDSPTVFGVVREQDGWAAVSTPKLANGRLGWIRLDGERLNAGWTRMSIVVDLSRRVAELRERDEPVRSFAVTVGAPGMETPTGQFAVTDSLRGGGLNPVYGCCALALSATQPNLPSGWLGGNRIAIHATSGPLGTADSQGCVRAADADVDALIDEVPLGTPVFIRD